MQLIWFLVCYFHTWFSNILLDSCILIVYVCSLCSTLVLWLNHFTILCIYPLEEGSIVRQLDSKRQDPGAGDLESDAAFRPGSVSTRHLTLWGYTISTSFAFLICNTVATWKVGESGGGVREKGGRWRAPVGKDLAALATTCLCLVWLPPFQYLLGPPLVRELPQPSAPHRKLHTHNFHTGFSNCRISCAGAGREGGRLLKQRNYMW